MCVGCCRSSYDGSNHHKQQPTRIDCAAAIISHCCCFSMAAAPFVVVTGGNTGVAAISTVGARPSLQRYKGENTRLERALLRVIRHDEDITRDSDGYVRLTDVLEVVSRLRSISTRFITLSDVKTIFDNKLDRKTGNPYFAVKTVAPDDVFVRCPARCIRNKDVSSSTSPALTALRRASNPVDAWNRA